LLEYSRLNLERYELAPTALADVVGDALGELDAHLLERRAKVTVERPLPAVMVHRVMLVQALTNLLTNAAKFVAQGVDPEVTIRCEIDGPRVRLWVEDNGIGIAPEHHERIFRVFERLHGRDSYPGTGIGLAIVKRAADRMGGSAGVESEVGRGSRFWMDLSRA
jgi:signal transduction histidine kinase